MSNKLTFIEEAETRGFYYRPQGILGNGFYGNGLYIPLSDMEKLTKTGVVTTERMINEDTKKINSDYFIKCEKKEAFYTNDLLELFPDIKEHQLHNFLNRYKDIFLSQKLFVISNGKRVFSKEAVKFIYSKLIKKEEPVVKKRGRRSNKIETR